jgi:putative OPT family oligopeptide transporter
VGIPLIALTENQISMPPLDLAWTLWSEKIRYIGVGAMLVGGVTSIFTVKDGLFMAFKELTKKTSVKENSKLKIEDQDISKNSMLIVLSICFLLILYIYNSMLHNLGLSLFTTFLMLLVAFPLVAVSSYIVGLVGSSNNPVSGIVIGILLAVSALFLLLGYHTQSAILATLGVASVICCAVCTAGDCSQDLKTGQIIGASPRAQQIAEAIGIVVPAFTLAPILTLLHTAYGIGDGLKAPQAALFASITKAMFGDGDLPDFYIYMGILLGFLILALDVLCKKIDSKFRFHLMPLAVGIYLPVTLAVPIFLGGLIHYIAQRKSAEEPSERGILFASGLISGEAISGVLIAAFLVAKVPLNFAQPSDFVANFVSIFAVILLGFKVFSEATSRNH